ncbi:hypothetical protein NMY22_g10524 [Coprinellus aureogranulatus]|nr:hypothetical protein NMY22_g10524 [Coprinellus aureogranulatus]
MTFTPAVADTSIMLRSQQASAAVDWVVLAITGLLNRGVDEYMGMNIESISNSARSESKRSGRRFRHTESDIRLAVSYLTRGLVDLVNDDETISDGQRSIVLTNRGQIIWNELLYEPLSTPGARSSHSKRNRPFIQTPRNREKVRNHHDSQVKHFRELVARLGRRAATTKG